MKTKFLSLAVLMTFLISCSSDDDKTKNSILQERIIGKWLLMSEKETLNGTVVSEANWQHKCSTSRDYVEFFENGEFDWIEYQTSCEIDALNSNQDATYSVSGTTININGDEELTSVKVEMATETTLVIKTESNSEGNNSIFYTTLTKA